MALPGPGGPRRKDLRAASAAADSAPPPRGNANYVRGSSAASVSSVSASDGGLSQALVEASVQSGIGAEVALLGDPFLALFSESAGRCLVTTHLHDGSAFLDLAARHGLPVTEIGVTGTETLKVTGGTGESAVAFEIGLVELGSIWRDTLPNALA